MRHYWRKFANSQNHCLDSTAISGIFIITYLASGLLGVQRASKHDRKRSKADALREEGTLNPAPEKVRDPKFQEGEFFDPRDVVQVKYEMLRRVSVEKASVTDATDEYGVSRPTYYQAKANFDEAGIAGLVPKKRGPRGPHKIQGEVLAFLRDAACSRASRSGRASWRSWSGRSSASMCIRGRSSARSAEKKRRDDRRPGRKPSTHSSADRRPVRDAAHGRARRGAAAGGPQRADRLSPPRHVGMGAGAGRRQCPAGAASARRSLESDGALRASSRHSPLRRHGNDDQ